MKRIILILVLIATLLLVLPVSANTALNFQNPVDFTGILAAGGTGTPRVTWIQNTTGGNSYVRADNLVGPNAGFVVSQTASPMTYSATTLAQATGGGFEGILFDSAFTTLALFVDSDAADVGTRYEIKVVGGTATFYKNGVEKSHFDGLTQNPSYIGWGGQTQWVDDVVWGSSEPLNSNASDKYVYGVPETDRSGHPYYMLMKDFINPAANGFYFGNGTLISSFTFPSTFSKGNSNNDTINLQGYATGVNVIQAYTGSAYSGKIYWDLSSFFAASPDYGMYALHSESSLKYSDLILYVGNGATISWNQLTYSQGDTGAILTVVSTGGYWDPANYNYRVDVMDVYGVVDATYPVTTQTATISHTWDADQAIGVYYAAIIATPKTGTSPADDIWMNVAITNVDAYLTLHGYVFNGENETAINGANVNITQGMDINNVATPSDGNYTVSGLAQGATLSINVSATGYETYYHQFTPLRVGSLELNFTLLPTSHTYSGIALGGVARETPYNRTINNARIDIVNSTDGHVYSATTNSVGYYVKNNMAGPSHWFNVWGSKSGFLNSTVYQKLVVGS